MNNGSFSSEINNNNQLSNETSEKVLSLKAKAMQFRNLVKTEPNTEQLNDKEIKNGDLVVQKDNKKLKFLKPLTVIMLFVIVFSISICTIIYLTYHQKSNNREYDSVKVDEPTLSDETDTSQHTASPQVQKTSNKMRKLRFFKTKKNQDAISNSEDSQNLSASNDEKSSQEIEIHAENNDKTNDKN